MKYFWIAMMLGSGVLAIDASMMMNFYNRLEQQYYSYMRQLYFFIGLFAGSFIFFLGSLR